MQASKYILGLFALVLGLVGLSLGYAPDGQLHLVACDVGQGDGILAIYKDTQILIDGGPDERILECLSEHVPFWDRRLELVILTHPQLDHYGGLIEVFRRYNVDTFLANGLDSGASSYRALKSAVGGSGAKVVTPKDGMVLRIGMIYLDILSPSRTLLTQEAPDSRTNILGAFVSKRDPNDFSVVAIMRLGEFDALFTGDIGPSEIPEILARGKVRDVEYIKVPHHGSKNGLTHELLDASSPEIGVISVGKNSYGHPNEETLKMLKEKGVRILRTDEEGDIEVVSDGLSFWTE
jgi:competence protein ComEC